MPGDKPPQNLCFTRRAPDGCSLLGIANVGGDCRPTHQQFVNLVVDPVDFFPQGGEGGVAFGHVLAKFEIEFQRASQGGPDFGNRPRKGANM